MKKIYNPVFFKYVFASVLVATVFQASANAVDITTPTEFSSTNYVADTEYILQNTDSSASTTWTLSGDLPTFNGNNITINGNNYILDGGGTNKNYFNSYNKTGNIIKDLTLTNLQVNTEKGLLNVNYHSNLAINNLSIQNVNSPTNNSSSVWGGIVEVINGSTAEIKNSSFENIIIESSNTTATWPEFTGGILHIQKNVGYGNSSISKIEDTSFSNNNFTSTGKDAWGGAIYAGGNIGSISSSGSSIITKFENNILNTTNGYNAYGGAIATETSSTGVIDYVQFSGNEVKAESGNALGGAIYNHSNTSIGKISNTIFDSNSATSTSGSSYGGAISNAGTINGIYNSTFNNNSSGTAGGAIYNTGTITEISNTTFTNNTTKTGGGAIYTTTDIVLRNGTSLSNNKTTGNTTSQWINSNDIHLANGANLIIDYDSVKDTISNTVSINSGITSDNNTSSVIIQNGAQLNLAGHNWYYQGKMDVQNGTLNFTKGSADSFAQGIVNLGDKGTFNYSTNNTNESDFEDIEILTGSGTFNKLGSGILKINKTNNSTDKFTGTINLNSGRMDIYAAAQDATGQANKEFDFTVNVNNASILNYKANWDGGSIDDQFRIANNSKVNFTDTASGAEINFTTGTYELAGDLNNAENNYVAFNNATVHSVASVLNGNYSINNSAFKIFNDVAFNGEIKLGYAVPVTLQNGADATFENLVLTSNSSLNGDANSVVTINGLSGNNTLNNNGTTVSINKDLSAFTGDYNQNSGVTNVVGTFFGGNSTINNGTLNWLNSNDLATGSTLTVNNGILNIGDANTTAEFDLRSVDTIADAVAININNNSTLNIENGAQLKLDTSDIWSGTINNSGSLTINNYTVNKDATLTQNGGEIIFDNNSNAHIDSTDLISGGNFSLLNGSNIYFDSINSFQADNFVIGNNSNIALMNGSIEKLEINNLNVLNQNNISIDIATRNQTSDKLLILGDLVGSGTNNVINISDFNFIDGVPADKNINLQIVDVNGNISDLEFKTTNKEVATPVGNYRLFSQGGGAYNLGLTSYNNQVFRGQVATLASYNNQLLVNDMMLNHFILQNERAINQTAQANKYASANTLFAPYQHNLENGGLWTKTYAAFETLSMTQGLNVGNNSYGTLIGADFPVIKLKDGWKFVPTAYIGYQGANQYFNKVDMYQNGGQGGFMGTFMKKDFIGSIVAYGGGYFNEMNVAGYTDKTGNWFAGTAAKAAYNIHATKHFTIQPTVLVSYNIFGKQSWDSDYGALGMNSGLLNGVNVAPGLNLIYSRDTWSVYGTVQYMYNINDQVGGHAGNIALPTVSMRHGYLQYGVGVTKSWKDRLNSFLQVNLRNGGRTGIGFQLGLKYLFDWGKPSKKSQAEKYKKIIK